MPHIYLDSHGVKLDVEVQDEALVPVVEQILPPGWRPSGDFPEDGHFTIARRDDDRYDVLMEGTHLADGVDRDIALHVLDAQLRARIAFLAEGRIFVHAGAVAVGARTIVVPGPSFSGKSSLVGALVAQGATYYSDEFAVLDPDGLVHPYPKPLSLRSPEQRYGERHAAESLGGPVGDTPVPIGLIAVTRYVPDARWQPERRNAGAGALALLTNAVPARSRPEEATRAAGKAAAGAIVLEGPRGDAAETAALLLDALRE